MKEQEFIDQFTGMAQGFGRSSNTAQAKIWFQAMRDRRYTLPVVARAVERLIANNPRFPVLKDLIAECSKIQVSIAERERAKEKDVENAPFRAVTVDGTPVSQIAAKVSAALRGDNEARVELGWDEKETA